MTGPLTDLMRERADALERPHVDLADIVRQGDRRIRRRRTAMVGGVVAAALVAVAAVPALVGSGDPRTGVDPDLATAFAEHAPSYAVGSTVTIDGHDLELPVALRAYVQTNVGVVFTDDKGTVYSADGSQVSTVGRINARIPRLVADGDLAAWVEPGEDGVPVFTVLDQRTTRVWHDAMANVAGMSDIRDGRDPAVVYALDGTTLYLRDHEGAATWDVETGETRRLDPDADGFTITDAKDGRIVYTPTGSDGDGVRVGTSLDEGIDLPLWTSYTLSPDGRYLMGEPEPDVMRIYDTRTGEEMPYDDLGYAYFGGYQWLDDGHYAALGLEETEFDSPIDILSCTVATGDCAVAEDVGTLDEGFAVPNGLYLN